MVKFHSRAPKTKQLGIKEQMNFQGPSSSLPSHFSRISVIAAIYFEQD